jgi:hypothetical protein
MVVQPLDDVFDGKSGRGDNGAAAFVGHRLKEQAEVAKP